MNNKLLYEIPNLKTNLFLLFFSLFLFGFSQTNDSSCGNIENFEFANTHESVQILDNETYIYDDLPEHFYVQVGIHGYVQSVRYQVTNLDTNETYEIIENLVPYTFPSGNGDWDIGQGTFEITATAYSQNDAHGIQCDSDTITFTLSDTAPCIADAGTLTATATQVCSTGGVTISAHANGDAVVPTDYSVLYVLTQGDGLIIEQVNATPEFTVSGGGNYTIHTLVYPNGLDLSIVELGVTTGFDVNSLLIQGGGELCAALDVAGAPVHITNPDAGTLTATDTSVELSNGEAALSATPNGDANTPSGYSTLFVLTQGEGLVIAQVAATPDFTVTEAGNYIIHTLVYPNGLDLSVVELGVTTGFDVNGLLVQGGGDLCAALDVAGAPIHVSEAPCSADAGTLAATASQVCSTGEVTISAEANGDAVVPTDYSVLYVLTQGDGLIIEQVNATPEFTVSGGGNYTIHTLVYPNGLDLSIVELGVTTGFDVNSLLIQGGGELCAALDVAGAPVHITNPDAGTLTATDTSVELSNGEASLSATPNGDANAPSGYSTLYVLTQGNDLVIEQVSGTPEFTVTEAGNYTIHTLVYPNTLDLSIVELGVTTGFDVNGLLIQGGGDLCASLDVAGAPIHVSEAPCLADAGTLTATATQVCSTGEVTISAHANGDAVVPTDYSVLYVLTQGDGLIIEQVNGTPEFTVSGGGDYTIHTLVYPNGLDLSIVELGVTTGFDVNSLLIQGGGELCAALDVVGAPVHITNPDAGTLTATDTSVELSNEEAALSATPNGDANTPSGYSTLFVLTQGEGLVITQVAATPDFTVTEAGNYTIHTLVYPTGLDLSVVELGVTTGFDVNGLLIQGGGDLCASLDVAGAPIHVSEAPCLADAGTLTATDASVTLSEGSAVISAHANGDAVVPTDYSVLYVLTQGNDLVIEQVSGTPEFTVTEAGNYIIHTLVYPNGLDLSVVELGVTTGFDVNGLLVQGGGDLCAALDVAGALIHVSEAPCSADAGTLAATATQVCSTGEVTISAHANGDAVVPTDYSVLYVLTQGDGLIIEQVNGTPEFTISGGGDYTIHTLVYPNGLDLSIVELGVTTGFDVNSLLIQGGGELCAALDVAGAPVHITNPDAGTLTATDTSVELSNGEAALSATPNGDANAPSGYSTLFVLTQGEGLVIEQVAATPDFTVTEAGNFTIHTLVYPNGLDLSIVELGVTTGFDVNSLLIQGGGELCAALDVAGAPIHVSEAPCLADAGTLTATDASVTLSEGSTVISAHANGDAVVPNDYLVLYVLTQGNDLVIEQVSGTPEFTVTEAGNYIIHTLVYPNTLDLSIVELGVTTGFDVNSLLIQGGGELCASLDVAGAPIHVSEAVCIADAGTLTATDASVTLSEGSAVISAHANGDAVVPNDYLVLYVLTQGNDLVIEQVSGTPEFTVTEAGNYTIHTLVYPNTLDLSIVELGVTTGFDVNSLLIQGGGELCASLDVAGAPIHVQAGDDGCNANAGTLYSYDPIQCLDGGVATIYAEEVDAPVIPDGYSQLFVLTDAFNLTILDVSEAPQFDINHVGFYRIHSLVYNASTLDLSIVEFGHTTAFDILPLLEQEGGNICASLDVHGAVNLVAPGFLCDFFNDYYGYGRGTNAAGDAVNNWVNQYDSYESFQEDILSELTEASVYPNPVKVNTNLNIKTVLFENETVNYSIIDIQGRVLKRGVVTTLSSNKHQINMSNLSIGTYIVKLNSEFRNFTTKVQVN